MTKIRSGILVLVLLIFWGSAAAQMQSESLSNAISENPISAGNPGQNFMEFTQKYRDQFLAPAWNRFKNNEVGNQIGHQIDAQTLSTTSFLVGVLGAPSEGMTHFWEVIIRAISGLILAGQSAGNIPVSDQDYVLSLLFTKVSEPLAKLISGAFKKFAAFESSFAPIDRSATDKIIDLASPEIAKAALILIGFIVLLRIRKMIFGRRKAALARRMRARRVRQYRG